MSDSTPYYYLVGFQGLRPDGTLSRKPGMKSGDFHACGSYRYNMAAGRQGEAV